MGSTATAQGKIHPLFVMPCAMLWCRIKQTKIVDETNDLFFELIVYTFVTSAPEMAVRIVFSLLYVYMYKNKIIALLFPFEKRAYIWIN